MVLTIFLFKLLSLKQQKIILDKIKTNNCKKRKGGGEREQQCYIVTLERSQYMHIRTFVRDL